MMGYKSCMNILCGTTSSTEWKSGWSLRSGDFALLCHKCGYAFEQQKFCEEFHGDDSGWRECITCAKRLHCGCIASLSLIELLDSGGVRCISCARNLGRNLNPIARKCDRPGPCVVTDNNGGLKQLANCKENNGSNQLPTMQCPNPNVAFGLLKQEEHLLPPPQAGSSWVSNLAQSSMTFFQKPRFDISIMQGKDNYGSMAHPNLNTSLGVPSGNFQASSSAIIDDTEQRKISDTFHQGLVSSNLFPAPPKLAFSPAAETNLNVIPQACVARPPVEGRGRHQLLPRYWPRITDQELQQITGDSNCTIVPLFEKVLSASDAGRIGRLVLPKACAEAYFPPISQPEGLSIKIQDVKGKEWLFQFRFWPNNNSRMYVLEGVTPCIQTMQLQAGDTVTFSRMDPEGKLIMGFRKASKSGSVQSMKSTDTHMNALPGQLDSAGGNVQWHNSDKYHERTEEGTLTTSMFMLERKKSRNIGSKNKRLVMDSQDVLALRLTWDEVQGLLRPPQASRPIVVVVEDYEFEEYEEPPVFGKNSIFAARSTGVMEQWVQCDSCLKWRRLPMDVLLPPKWTCADNAWDQIRCSCSVPEELSPKELESIQQLNKDSTAKRRMSMANKMAQEQEASDLNTMATAATLGDNTADPGTSSVAATTKHPRHRPGCSCIVCIQPPSGKGKHKSTCTCIVCMTVKRRFKTLMTRKKKRQSEQEAEIALKNQQKQNSIIKEDDKFDTDNNRSPFEHQLETEAGLQVGMSPTQIDDGQGLQNQTNLLAETSKSLDLNFHPGREEDFRMKSSKASLTNLLQLASLPLESYMKQHGLSSLSSEQAESASQPRQAAVGEIGNKVVEDYPLIPVAQGPPEETNPGNGNCEPGNKQPSDPL